MLANSNYFCPCGSGNRYSQCCEKIIIAAISASTPEQLMRSRYSAYFFKNEDYLLKSWHHSTRPESLQLNKDTSEWKLLRIISAKENLVHFVAYFSDINNSGITIFALNEESEFIYENGEWFYLTGKNLSTGEISKNMICPCKSGKKFKRCCLTLLNTN